MVYSSPGQGFTPNFVKPPLCYTGYQVSMAEVTDASQIQVPSLQAFRLSPAEVKTEFFDVAFLLPFSLCLKKTLVSLHGEMPFLQKLKIELSLKSRLVSYSLDSACSCSILENYECILPFLWAQTWLNPCSEYTSARPCKGLTF